ncbi:MAG TPA: alpha/beta hydrolase, partial [Sphingomonadales bacterium]|nr:alpha/beta hydrolase [Sphingomonadales bacterium]
PDTRQTLIYASRAHLAASLGIASLIFDKRGSGKSTGNAPYELENLVMDGASAVAALRRHPKIDAGRVGVGGFSQGGWVAPALAGRDGAIAFVVVGSAPGITPAEQNIFSLVSRLQADMGPDAVAAAADGLRQVYAYYRTGEGYTELMDRLGDQDTKAWSQTPIFKRLLFTPDGEVAKNVEPGAYDTLFFDPLPYWEKISVPVFAVWGEEDSNVPANQSRELITERLPRNGLVTAIVYPGTGHGLDLENPADGEYRFFRLNPDYLSALEKFLKGIAQSKTGEE